MSSVAIETTAPETASCSGVSRPFGDLRGVRWRIDLGILPPSASVDDLRRVTANSRRRYAALRRQLLVDPHVPKDGSNSPDPVMDNPLSQNPDSMWGRFFKNAELERMVDQDLTRLYPERGSYFQTSGCQGMLRRILLLWCLRHPEYGYRQGMHELLAPLLYVLQVDVERLSEVRKNYDDYFADKFDGFSFHENDLTYKFDFKKFSDSEEEWNGFEKSSVKANSLSELDSEIQTIVFLSDAYGAEGELGIVLSEKFLEHDAYSMFDALMSGAGGAVSMAEFFCPSPFKDTNTGFPPVIEASAALYHLLSVVDLSLHSHLVELGVEPQYFALRWLRVLFGREFSLEDLLVIWDEIFAHENTKNSKAVESDAETNFGILESPRGAFISAFAVSMILSLRSSLLATEHATACLQRLLNFPVDIDLAKLVAKAKSLQDLAVDANSSITQPIHPWSKDGKKSGHTRAHSLSLDPTSPTSLLGLVPESYWEEKWRVLHKEEEQKLSSVEEQVPIRKKGWSERVKLRLSRTESDPSPSSINGKTKTPKPAVRRSLLDDLARQLGSNEDKNNAGPDEDVNHQERVEVSGEDVNGKNFGNTSHGAGSEDNSSSLSGPSSPIHGKRDEEFISGRSSVASNSSIDETDAEVCETNQEEGNSKLCETTLKDRNAKLSGTNQEEGNANVCGNILEGGIAESSGTNRESPRLPVSDQPEGVSPKVTQNDDSEEKLNAGMKERKLLSGKFQWLWKFGRNANEGASERAPEDAKACSSGSGQSNLAGIHAGNGCDGSSGTSKGETVDQNLMVTLRHLGQSMLENIQVIESAFQQERGLTGTLENSKNGFVGKGQVTAMSAIKELRKISNLLSEM